MIYSAVWIDTKSKKDESKCFLSLSDVMVMIAEKHLVKLLDKWLNQPKSVLKVP